MSESKQFPPEELARLRAIADLDLFSPDVEAVLEELTQEAAEAVNLPIALVSVVTDGAQYFAASHGLEGWIAEAGGTPKEWSFCQHAVASKETFVVENAAQDERVNASPLVTQDGIACYLGVPLTTSGGHVLGTLCVIGGESRTFSPEDHELVSALAREAVERIEARTRTSD